MKEKTTINVMDVHRILNIKSKKQRKKDTNI